MFVEEKGKLYDVLAECSRFTECEEYQQHKQYGTCLYISKSSHFYCANKLCKIELLPKWEKCE